MKKVEFCIECRKKTEYILQNVHCHHIIKGKKYEFELIKAFCTECRCEMDIHGLTDYNISKVDQQYREKEDIISINDIQKMLEIYHIGKAPLSLALGFGEITVTRYLEGQIPSKEYSDIMKRCLYYPKYMIEHLNRNVDKIGEAAYRKAKKAAEELSTLFGVSDKMLLTISYIFKMTQEITPLALQKILYYVQGIYMTLYNKPLFLQFCN